MGGFSTSTTAEGPGLIASTVRQWRRTVMKSYTKPELKKHDTLKQVTFSSH